MWGSWLCFGKGTFMTLRSGSSCPSGFVVHCGDPETSETMLSGDGSLALILSLCKDEGYLQRWGLVM